jgi:hypothetical protein
MAPKDIIEKILNDDKDPDIAGRPGRRPAASSP